MFDQLTRRTTLADWKPEARKPRKPGAEDDDQPQQHRITAGTSAPVPPIQEHDHSPRETSMLDEHRTAILAALKKGPLKPAALSKTTGISKPTLKASLKELLSAGDVNAAGATAGRIYGLPGQDLGAPADKPSKAAKKKAGKAHASKRLAPRAVPDPVQQPTEKIDAGFGISHVGHLGISKGKERIELNAAEFAALRNFIDSSAGIWS